MVQGENERETILRGTCHEDPRCSFAGGFRCGFPVRVRGRSAHGEGHGVLRNQSRLDPCRVFCAFRTGAGSGPGSDRNVVPPQRGSPVGPATRRRLRFLSALAEGTQDASPVRLGRGSRRPWRSKVPTTRRRRFRRRFGTISERESVRCGCFTQATATCTSMMHRLGSASSREKIPSMPGRSFPGLNLKVVDIFEDELEADEG